MSPFYMITYMHRNIEDFTKNIMVTYGPQDYEGLKKFF